MADLRLVIEISHSEYFCDTKPKSIKASSTLVLK